MDKVLLIVDIQKDYNQHFTQGYLNKIENYLEKNKDSYSEIYVMIDILRHSVNGDFIPRFIGEYNNRKHIFKSYNKDYTMDKIRENSDFKIDLLDNGLLSITPKITEKKFIKKLKKGYLLSGIDSNYRFIEYIDDDFAKAILKWKKNNDQVFLIGGGLDHCVQKTSTILDVFGVKNRTLKTYCFEIKERTSKGIDTDWVYLENENIDLKEYFKRTS